MEIKSIAQAGYVLCHRFDEDYLSFANDFPCARSAVLMIPIAFGPSSMKSQQLSLCELCDLVQASDSDRSERPQRWLTDALWNGYKSASYFRSRPNFLREETILSYQCFTLDVNGAEATFSPEFGMTPLRFESKGGTLIEALKVY